MRAPGLRTAAALVAAAAVGGCSSLFGGDVPPPTYFVWRDAGQSAPAGQASARTLLVVPTTTATFYDSQRIAFSRAAGTRGQYEFAAWTERPGKRFDVLLVERLDQRGAFRRVAATTSGASGDLLLAASILDLYHDASAPRGAARLRVSVELTDRGARALLARRTFDQEAPVEPANAAAAVAGLNAAVARLLDDLVPWVEGVAAKAGPR
jgi:cholesterol transport system auxiliary component